MIDQVTSLILSIANQKITVLSKVAREFETAVENATLQDDFGVINTYLESLPPGARSIIERFSD